MCETHAYERGVACSLDRDFSHATFRGTLRGKTLRYYSMCPVMGESSLVWGKEWGGVVEADLEKGGELGGEGGVSWGGENPAGGRVALGLAEVGDAARKVLLSQAQHALHLVVRGASQSEEQARGRVERVGKAGEWQRNAQGVS